MKRGVFLAGGLLGLASTAHSMELFFIGRDIKLTQAFVCGGRQPAGPYTLEALYDPDSEDKGSVLRVVRGEKSLCETKGARSSAYDSMGTRKLRVITRVDAKEQAIEINIIVPAAMRSTLPNQKFLLPLHSKH